MCLGFFALPRCWDTFGTLVLELQGVNVCGNHCVCRWLTGVWHCSVCAWVWMWSGQLYLSSALMVTWKLRTRNIPVLSFFKICFVSHIVAHFQPIDPSWRKMTACKLKFKWIQAEGIAFPCMHDIFPSWKLDVFLFSIQKKSVMEDWSIFLISLLKLDSVSVVVKVTPCLLLGCRRPVWCVFENGKLAVLQAN